MSSMEYTSEADIISIVVDNHYSSKLYSAGKALMAASQGTRLVESALNPVFKLLNRRGTDLEANVPEESDAVSVDTNKKEPTGPSHGAYETDVDSIYNAAVNGEIGVFKAHPECIDRFETPAKNSVLHVFITAKPHPQEESNTRDEREEFVKEILRMRPDLLRKTNGKDEIPLHIAARHGHSDVVETLLKWCRKDHENELEKGNGAVRGMLMMTNKAKDTALHEAVRYNHIDVVVALTKGNLNVPYDANLHGESPLYLAVERGNANVIDAMLKESSSWAHGGPNGRTTLHAAVHHHNEVLTEKLLREVERKEMITQKSDEKGWIPLHYAAYFGYAAIVKRLLKEDKSSACIPTTTEKMTAIHLAARGGNLSVMHELISSCPRCCELVDRRGWNVVHFAVVCKNEQVVEYVLRSPLFRNLINERNSEGNAPLHLLIDSGLLMRSFIKDPRVDILALNAKNLSCLDIVSSMGDGSRAQMEAVRRLIECRVSWGEGIIAERKDWHGNEDTIEAHEDFMKQIKDARESHLIVATLVATVSFAAGFTMPGGYKSDGPDEGGAILTRSKAFQAFVITNTVSMMLSSSAVFAHFFMAIRQDKKLVFQMFVLALSLTFLAMIAMVIAFISGTYAVLAHVQALAISTCVLACSLVGFYYYPLHLLILTPSA